MDKIVTKNDMFLWDGSEITTFIEDCNVEEAIYEKTVYWKISFHGQEEYCCVRLSLTSFPCLIDELKIIFQLEKIGTHWIHFRGRKLILQKVLFEDGKIIQDLTLDKIHYRKDLEKDVQRIFIFRELLGVTRNWEKSIVLREVHSFVKPISFYEPNMIPAKRGKVIPETILNRWFQNLTLNEAVKNLFEINRQEEIVGLIHKLRIQMESVVNRVEKYAISEVDEILLRISFRLSFILEK